MSEKTAPLTEHLEDLRKVLVWSLIAVLIGTAISYGLFIDRIMEIVVGPLERLGQELVFLAVTEGFFTQLKVAFFAGIVLASPVIIWQLLSFILPALYSHEKRLFFPLFFFGILLFVAGIVFGYVFVLELGLKILLINFSGGLTPMISVSKYVAFVISFLLPFGIVFEIPLITYFLTKLGIVTPQYLRKNRRFIIFIMVVLAAVLSPGGDIVAQMFLALPMIILYEFSIIISSVVYKRKQRKMAQEEAEDGEKEI
ncbi:MAG: twin-arginine translocase subunit TatC [Clostridia bacterium]|nr:twin-arginine translocase subunit TatC [Clostridia bacterium]